jgi:flagellar protein FlgJ
MSDGVADHPAKNSSVGSIEGRKPLLWGEGADFGERLGQVQDSTFLQAYERLKGGGVITDFEGKKAEAALARLSRAKSEENFNAALVDLREVVQNGLLIAQQKAAGPNVPSPLQQTQGNNQAPTNIPEQAVNMLRQNPNTAAEFDEMFGAGAAQRILNGG